MTTQSSTARILCVDDERAVLQALKRVFRGKNYQVDLSTSASEALELVAMNDYDVVISDMRMPKMDGAEFLHAASVFSPATQRILLTGYSQHAATERAINNGKISAFVNKPWDNSALLQVVDQALLCKRLTDQDRHNQANLKRNNRVLFDKNVLLRKEAEVAQQELDQSLHLTDVVQEDLTASFNASVSLFSNIINQRLGCQFQQHETISELSFLLGQKLGLGKACCQDLRMAGKLFSLGKVNFTEHMLRQPPENLSSTELAHYYNHPALGAELLAPLKSLQGVAAIIHGYCESYDGSGFPRGLEGTAIPLSSRILTATIEFQRLWDATPALRSKNLLGMSGKQLDPLIVELLLTEDWSNINDATSTETKIRIADLKPYMNISRNVYGDDGKLLLAKGTTVDPAYLQHTQDLSEDPSTAVAVFVDSAYFQYYEMQNKRESDS